VVCALYTTSEDNPAIAERSGTREFLKLAGNRSGLLNADSCNVRKHGGARREQKVARRKGFVAHARMYVLAEKRIIRIYLNSRTLLCSHVVI